MEITDNTPIAMLTVGQLKEILGQTQPEPEVKDFTEGIVFGLAGIRNLFQVSHVTAQRYKDSWLQPAVRQNGRKIIVDVDHALRLFDQYKNPAARTDGE